MKSSNPKPGNVSATNLPQVFKNAFSKDKLQSSIKTPIGMKSSKLKRHSENEDASYNTLFLPDSLVSRTDCFKTPSKVPKLIPNSTTTKHSQVKNCNNPIPKTNIHSKCNQEKYTRVLSKQASSVFKGDSPIKTETLPKTKCVDFEVSLQAKAKDVKDHTFRTLSAKSLGDLKAEEHMNSVVLQEERRKLPIFPVKKELITNITQNPTVIIIGETACGKTTQIPQFLLETSLLKTGAIAITQPRRVAAITIASRVSLEVGTTLGETVGYSVRFEDVTSESTKIKFLTDGMMLRESIIDPLLRRYPVIILDEAHERTIHTDVLFGIIKKAQEVRKARNLLPLKVIIMSATMDVDHFSKYFNNAPVFYLKGRQHPIEVMHAVKPQTDYIFSTLVTVFQIHRKESKGDILVFCTGQEEIESLVKSAKETSLQLPPGSTPIIALPLYASLPSRQQLKVFIPTPTGSRKVIFSTNVAETSVTIPGIKYVVDTGVVKARTYYPGSGLDLLKVQKVSKAQAWQRTGRAGRETSGTCFRLYTEEEFSKLREHTIPEILRCNLANVILQLLAIGIQEIDKFDFIDKPSAESLESAFTQLGLLGAIEEKQNTMILTSVGKQMSAFPLEPRFSKTLLASKELGCTDEILTIISLLSIDSVFFAPSKKRERAAEVRKKFESSEGDYIMLLNVYKGFKSFKGSKAWCKENFVHHRNLQMAVAIRKQLLDLCDKAGIPPSSCSGQKDSTAVRQCFVTGLFMNVAELQQGKQYLTVDTRQEVMIHPTSCLFQGKPAYVIFTELVQTSKCYMRSVSVVDPAWLWDCAPGYFRRKRLAKA